VSSNARLWAHWVIANALAEVVGLGLVGAIAWLAFGAVGERPGAALVLAFAAFTVALGSIEGAVVGWAQSLVIRERIAGLEGWVRATVIGALVAWFAGMLPSTVMNLMPHDPAASEPAIGEGARLALAAGLGAVAGPVLAAFQFRVLRRYVGHAARWLAANALAWAVGMPVIFAGIHMAHSDATPIAMAGIVIGTLAAAGAAVGAVHGLFLVHLLRPENRLPGPSVPRADGG
jgi:hypothetical protein